MRKDVLVRGWQPTRQEGVRAWEVWRQGRRKSLGSDELRTSALVLEEEAQVSGDVLVAALESVEVSVYALSVGACPVPHVIAHVDRRLLAESVVLLCCSGLEQGIILWQVERRKDVWHAVGEPCPIRVNAAFSWRPRRRTGEEACSDAREVPERWVFVGLAPTRQRGGRSAKSTGSVVVRVSAEGANTAAVGLKPPPRGWQLMANVRATPTGRAEAT